MYAVEGHAGHLGAGVMFSVDLAGGALGLPGGAVEMWLRWWQVAREIEGGVWRWQVAWEVGRGLKWWQTAREVEGGV